MDKNQEFYQNKNNYGEICAPVREKMLNYLIKEKFLSEFTTEEEKLKVLENLGISEKLELIQQLVNNKLDISLLGRYVTEETLNRRLQDLKPKNEKSKGYYSSYDELIENNPANSIGDWAIVNVEGTKYVFKFTNEGWVQGEIFDTDIDLSEYAKLSDIELLQTLLISGVNIKTINGQSLLGEGNLVIESGGGGEPVDLSNYVTKEYLYNIQNPLKASLYVSPTLVEYTGEPKNFTITCVAKKGNTTVNPNSVTINYRGITDTINGAYIAQVSEKGNTTFNVTCTYGEETVNCSATITLTLPTYLGFSTVEEAAYLDLNVLSKKVVSNIQMTESLQNTVKGNYLWIVSPYRVTNVATDPGFTYKVKMLALNNINGLYYYRSSSALDVSHLTYYIK